MTKVIRVKNSTFDTLVNSGKWTDTMDDIIRRLIISSGKYHRSRDDGKNLTEEVENK